MPTYSDPAAICNTLLRTLAGHKNQSCAIQLDALLSAAVVVLCHIRFKSMFLLTPAQLPRFFPGPV